MRAKALDMPSLLLLSSMVLSGTNVMETPAALIRLIDLMEILYPLQTWRAWNKWLSADWMQKPCMRRN